MKRIKHDPNAKLDYAWDWTDWLQVGESITAQTVTSPVTMTITDVTKVGNVVTAWVVTTLSGRLTCHVTTNFGREDDRSWFLEVEER